MMVDGAQHMRVYMTIQTGETIGQALMTQRCLMRCVRYTLSHTSVRCALLPARASLTIMKRWDNFTAHAAPHLVADKSGTDS